MQNESQNSKEVQGTRTAQQLHEQFNTATKDLFFQISYSDVKPSLQCVLLGWIANDFIENLPKEKRINIFKFYQKLCNHLEDFELLLNQTQNAIIPIENYNLFFEFNHKEAKKHFKTSLHFFLLTEYANDIDVRSDVVYHVSTVRKYVNIIYNIQNKLQN